MSLIHFDNLGLAAMVIFILVSVFVLCLVISFIFWLLYHRNVRRG